MFDKPFFPPDQPWYVWTVVILCFVFWLLAYALIIRWSFKDKTFGMPIAALIGNIAWEGLFSHYFVPSFWLIQLGNTAWVGLDVLIFIAAWKYGPADFAEPFIKRWLRTIMVVGVVMTCWIEIPFTRVYHDEHGYLLGWAQAFMMAILFIAMLVRRNSLKGQTIYTALAMLLGNIAAYLWCEYFPRHASAARSLGEPGVPGRDGFLQRRLRRDALAKMPGAWGEPVETFLVGVARTGPRPGHRPIAGRG